jgi:hypothetical protein
VNELQQLLTTFSGDHGHVAQLLAWMAAARLPLKLCSEQLQHFLAQSLAYLHDTPEKDDDLFALKILENPLYRAAAFFVDMLSSVKLPTATQFRAQFPAPPSQPEIRLTSAQPPTNKIDPSL